MCDKQKMRDEIISKAEEILDKRPLMLSDLSYFSIDVIMELEDMAKQGDTRAIRLKEKIKQTMDALKSQKQQMGLC